MFSYFYINIGTYIKHNPHFNMKVNEDNDIETKFMERVKKRRRMLLRANDMAVAEIKQNEKILKIL